MYATVLDTNVLRGLSSQRFAELNEKERDRAVRPYADPWTLMELIAQLQHPTSADYRPCREALRRAAARALLPLCNSPRMIAPSELQITRLVFGGASKDQEDNVSAFVELTRSLGTADPSDDLAEFRTDIRSVSDHVYRKEKWFTEYFVNLRQQVLNATKSATNRQRNKAVRNWTRSETAMRLDAEALIRRAYSQVNQTVPEPIPSNIVDGVLIMTRPGSCAAALVLERILCDDIDLEKSRHRNLMWDLEISASVGQTVDGVPIVIVTDDAYFAEAARLAGHPSAVCTLDAYLVRLGNH